MVDFQRQSGERRGALREFAAGRAALNLLQHRRGRVGPHVCAGALRIVRQAHAPVRILLADGRLKQLHLPRSIVNQRRENLAHEIAIVQRDIPELLAVQDGSDISNPHVSIVAAAGLR